MMEQVRRNGRQGWFSKKTYTQMEWVWERPEKCEKGTFSKCTDGYVLFCRNEKGQKRGRKEKYGKSLS